MTRPSPAVPSYEEPSLSPLGHCRATNQCSSRVTAHRCPDRSGRRDRAKLGPQRPPPALGALNDESLRPQQRVTHGGQEESRNQLRVCGRGRGPSPREGRARAVGDQTSQAAAGTPGAPLRLPSGKARRSSRKTNEDTKAPSTWGLLLGNQAPTPAATSLFPLPRQPRVGTSGLPRAPRARVPTEAQRMFTVPSACACQAQGLTRPHARYGLCVTAASRR